MYISSCYVELLLVLYTTAMLDSFCAKYNMFWTWSIVRVNIIIKITFDGGIRAIPWIRCRSKKLNDSGWPETRQRVAGKRCLTAVWNIYRSSIIKFGEINLYTNSMYRIPRPWLLFVFEVCVCVCVCTKTCINRALCSFLFSRWSGELRDVQASEEETFLTLVSGSFTTSFIALFAPPRHER